LQLAGFFIPREAKVVLKSLVYLFLIAFIGIVVRKALEVLR
jgi:hypothetical protein